MNTKEMIQEVFAGVAWFAMCVLCAVAVFVLAGCTPYF